MKIEISVKLLAKKPGEKIDIEFYEYDSDMGWLTSFIPTKILASGATKEDLEIYYNKNGVFLPDNLILIDAVIQLEI